ncbi:GNAT family N-acetyltransferase [Streptomyces sp. NPDC000594]|uniref:GNAT family N-acetyltransferase n=1 Tax=Streptomyces sp. NPDC000594 TaxID=3154261 RepID=UPI00331D33E4
MSDFDAGPLRASEYEAAVALLAYSFGTDERARALLDGVPPEQVFTVRRGDTLAAVGRWETATACLFGLPVPLAIQGMISAHPAMRRRGLLVPFAERMLGILRDQGLVLAGWKTAIPRWWQGFGWGPCAAVHRWSGLPGELRPIHDPAAGEAELAPAVAELDRLHRTWSAGRFGALLRDGAEWAALLRPGPSDVRRDTALWRGPDGTAEGYVRYRHTHTGPVGENRYEHLALVVDELAALTPGAYLGLLGFLSNHTTAPAFRWDAPVDDPLSTVVREPRALQPRTVVGGRVLRVVDTSRLTLPAGPGSAAAEGLRLTVADDLGPWNRGPWQVERDGPVLRLVPVPERESAPAVRIAALAWGPLVARYLTVEQALLCGLLSVPDTAARERLTALLPPAPAPYCPDEW